MNIKLILKTLSKILCIQGVYMLMSLAVSLYYHESVTPFLVPILGMIIIALPFFCMKVRNTIFSARDGLVCVALIWITMSFFGAIPFFINGGFGTFIDCLFESVSGFTTTGASVLREIESLPKGILFWRSSTHWLGGMGILVLALALFPSIGERAQNLMAAESPGPTCEKLTSRISTSSKILYMIYAGITVLQILCLYLADMPLYDSVVTSFATAGTGGFSVLNNSIAGYNNLSAEIIITIFTVLYGINFSVFFLLLTGQIKKVFKNTEFKFYISAIVIFITVITVNVYSIYQSVGTALRHASFNLVTIMSTTGFSSDDFNLWPTFSKLILVLAMIIGASAGSTGGGIKCSRVVILCKGIAREIRRMISPKRVSTLRMDGKAIPESTVTNTFVFTGLYAAITLGAGLIIALDGFDFTTIVTSVIACISNIGPALGDISGPTGNYADFSQLSKLVLSACMLIGRLEIFPMLVLILPATWKGASLKK